MKVKNQLQTSAYIAGFIKRFGETNVQPSD